MSHRDRDRQRQTERDGDRHRQTQGLRETQRDRQTETQRDKDSDRDTQRDRQRPRHRQRERVHTLRYLSSGTMINKEIGSTHVVTGRILSRRAQKGLKAVSTVTNEFRFQLHNNSLNHCRHIYFI